jgi:hypothetical protein
MKTLTIIPKLPQFTKKKKIYDRKKECVSAVICYTTLVTDKTNVCCRVLRITATAKYG